MAFLSVELGFCVWASGSFLGAVCGLRAICLLWRVGLAGFFVSGPVDSDVTGKAQVAENRVRTSA
jgi:hypothetical protein